MWQNGDGILRRMIWFEITTVGNERINKVNKNIHGVALEIQLTASNLTNYAAFCTHVVHMSTKHQRRYTFSDQKAIKHQARDPDKAEHIQYE